MWQLCSSRAASVISLRLQRSDGEGATPLSCESWPTTQGAAPPGFELANRLHMPQLRKAGYLQITHHIRLPRSPPVPLQPRVRRQLLPCHTVCQWVLQGITSRKARAARAVVRQQTALPTPCRTPEGSAGQHREALCGLPHCAHRRGTGPPSNDRRDTISGGAPPSLQRLACLGHAGVQVGVAHPLAGFPHVGHLHRQEQTHVDKSRAWCTFQQQRAGQSMAQPGCIACASSCAHRAQHDFGVQVVH